MRHYHVSALTHATDGGECERCHRTFDELWHFHNNHLRYCDACIEALQAEDSAFEQRKNQLFDMDEDDRVEYVLQLEADRDEWRSRYAAALEQLRLTRAELESHKGGVQ